MISPGETMEKVRVKTNYLIPILEGHYKRHKEELCAAQKAYRQKAIELLRARLARLSADQTVDLVFNLQPPDDHTEDYERAIKMLEMSEDEVVTITSTQFAAFAQDNWSWKSAFSARNSSYMS